MSLKTLALPAILLLALSSCWSPKSYQKVPMPDQDVPISDSSLARAYLIRSKQDMWRAWPIRIYSGENEVGALATGRFICWERPPGRILLRIVLDRPNTEGGHVEQLYDATMDAGGVYYVEIRLDGTSGRLVPTLVDDTRGRTLIKESKSVDVTP